MPRALNPADLRSQIERLRLTHPDVCDDEELFQLAIASETDTHEFMDILVDRMADAEKMALAQAALIKDLKTRRDRYLARHKAMRDLAFNIMQDAGLKKLELVQATLSIRNGTPWVIVTNESELPEDCIRVTREPNLTEIKRLIKEGRTIPGATLSNAEPTLMVT